MSWSLQIANGDLAFNGNDLSTVTGSDKLVQDLACCILEPMGTDDMHPSFGSLIDGGIDSSGNFNPGVIGAPNNAATAGLVDSEITRICNQYQASQQARYQSDLAAYGTSTLTASEVLLSIGGISNTVNQDQLEVTAVLQTGTGSQPFVLNVPNP